MELILSKYIGYINEKNDATMIINLRTQKRKWLF